MPWNEVTKRYRSSEKGKTTAQIYSRKYYHTVLKFKAEEVQKRRVANRLNHYLGKYGLTPSEADTLKATGCDLCGEKSGKMNIDHDHQSGEFRGILCNPCNLMLGWYEIALQRGEEIEEYLRPNVSLE